MEDALRRSLQKPRVVYIVIEAAAAVGSEGLLCGDTGGGLQKTWPTETQALTVPPPVLGPVGEATGAVGERSSCTEPRHAGLADCTLLKRNRYSVLASDDSETRAEDDYARSFVSDLGSGSESGTASGDAFDIEVRAAKAAAKVARPTTMKSAARCKTISATEAEAAKVLVVESSLLASAQAVGVPVVSKPRGNGAEAADAVQAGSNIQATARCKTISAAEATAVKTSVDESPLLDGAQAVGVRIASKPRGRGSGFVGAMQAGSNVQDKGRERTVLVNAAPGEEDKALANGFEVMLESFKAGQGASAGANLSPTIRAQAEFVALQIAREGTEFGKPFKRLRRRDPQPSQDAITAFGF